MQLNHLEFMVLAQLAEHANASRHRRYGLQIAYWLNNHGVGKVRLTSVYRVLANLERKGWASTESGAPDDRFAGTRRIYYSLTKEGETAFRQQAQRTFELVQVLGEAAVSGLSALDNEEATGRTA